MPVIRRDFKNVFNFMLKMIIVWIIAFGILEFFRNVGIESSGNFERIKPFNLMDEFLQTIVLGVLTGIFYSLLELLFDRPFFNRMSFGKLILFKNILFLLAAVLIFLLAVIFYVVKLNGSFQIAQIQKGMQESTFWVVIVFFMLVSIFISFILQVSQKFGPGMLWNFFIGKYHQPLVEERIFLFIDMRSSTTIAEQLGHIKFSRLIQDCFFDLTDVVTKNKVDVYQYVGDEAVLSWKKTVGLTDNRCLHAYYDFMDILNSKKDYYESTYGLQPFFKAGVHMGEVTAAEVGVVKKEIAYHGDVLNTAARIQGECNKLGHALLASETIIQHSNVPESFTAELMDAPLLRGKQQAVKIYGVKPI